MSNPWFRMYSEFSHDPKVQMMTEAMQRRYIMFMCLRCSNALVTLQETEIAFHMRISETDMAETKALFISKGFIDDDFNLLNWEKRQFASDTSNARVAKHRALQKEKQVDVCNADVTLPKQKSNALEQNRTDKDKDTDKKKSVARGSRLPENFEPDFQFAVDAGIQNTLEEVEKFRDYWHAQPGQKGVKTDWPATWRNWCRNAKGSPRQGFTPINKQEALEARNRAVGQRWADGEVMAGAI